MKKTEPTWKRQGFNSQYEYVTYRAQQRGYKSVRDYKLKNGIDTIKDDWRLKQRYDKCDPTAKEIPFAPGYYVTPEAVIWTYSEWKKCWLIISQQEHKSGYKAFQPYVDGKRRVKYVHRAVCSAYYGDCDNSYEAHHKDGDKHNNTLDNLVWLLKDHHRRLRRGPYKKS